MDKDWLFNEYITKDRSCIDISSEYGCKPNTIQCWLAKFKIKKQVKRKKRRKKYPEIIKEFLIEEHLNKEKNLAQISRETGASPDTLRLYCQEYDIDYWVTQPKTKFPDEVEEEICRLYTDEKISTNQLGKDYGVEHGTIKNILLRHNVDIRSFQESQLILHHEDGVSDLFYDAEKLNDLHWNHGMSCKEIGELLGGLEAGTVRRQMNSLGVKTKNNAESKVGLMIGENHPNWKNGITDLYLLLREFFTINLASKIVKRDGYKCQLCGAKGKDVILHVHHKIPFKEIVSEIMNEHPDLDPQDDKQELYKIITNDERFLDLNNLITYCKDCHFYKIHGYKRRDN